MLFPPLRPLSLRKKIILLLVVLVLLVGASFFLFVPVVVDRRLNPVLASPPYLASARAQSLHQQLLIVDLHADSLLWQRNLLTRQSRGHVDVPRLIEGNVALQAFTIVTKTPRGMNIESNDDQTDNITPLVIAEGWPISTWRSLKARTLYQASKLSDANCRSRSSGCTANTCRCASAKFHNPRCVTKAPFGLPVEPEV